MESQKEKISFSQLLVALVILGGIYWSVVGVVRLWGSFFGKGKGWLNMMIVGK